jgi:hypothetical protein
MVKLLYILLLIFIFVSQAIAQIVVDTSFEGANARILSINNSTNTVKIESKLRTGDTRNVVFYCKISGFNNNTPLKIQVKYSDQVYLPYLAAYSYDKINWFRFTGIVVGDSKEFTRIYSQNSVYFSVGYPYLYSDMVNLVNGISNFSSVQVSNIAVSHGGRQVKLIRITEPCVPDSGKYLIWLLGRNHSFESHSNYVVEGFINFAVSNNYSADMLRRQAIIYIVPIMDVDNAATGGTGKDQLPVDFNRDWDTPSYWPAVNAVKQKVAETVLQNQFKVFIDSHNPFPNSPGNSERLFTYSLYSSGLKSQYLDFYRKLFLENSAYPLDRQPLYLTDGQTSSRYMDSMYNSIDLTLSVETGWVNRTDNSEWTIPLYRYNGESLAKTINDYLSNIVKSNDVIVDNLDTVNNVIITGQWLPSTFVQGFWGSNYIYNAVQGQGTVKFIPQIQQTGEYEVFLRWTADPGRASNIPVKVTYNGGIKDTIVNQRIKGSEWVSTGVYNFQQGNAGSVLIQTAGTNGYVIADALKLTKRNMCNPIGITQNNVSVKYDVSVYPNPFNPSTTIKYSLLKSGFVELKIFDVTGKEIALLLRDYKSSGTHKINFDGSYVASGIYFYQYHVYELNHNIEFSSSGKIVLIK